MATRRTFISGLAMTSAGCIASPGLAAPALGRIAQRTEYVVDEHCAQAAQFAVEAVAAKARLHQISDDASSLWLRKLKSAAEGGRLSIAGLTCPTALFCLERMAWDHQMRVVFRIDHVRDDKGRWQHLHAGRPADAMFARFVADGDEFGATAFAALAESRPFWTDRTHGAPPSGTAALVEAPLTSWVIAPYNSIRT